MNLNNKFGECCKCPVKIADGRLYSTYVPRRDYNATIMKELKVTNSNEYRTILQDQGQVILDAVQQNLDTNYKCTDNGTNLFYQSTDIHKFFNDQLKDELNKPVSG